MTVLAGKALPQTRHVRGSNHVMMNVLPDRCVLPLATAASRLRPQSRPRLTPDACTAACALPRTRPLQHDFSLAAPRSVPGKAIIIAVIDNIGKGASSGAACSAKPLGLEGHVALGSAPARHGARLARRSLGTVLGSAPARHGARLARRPLGTAPIPISLWELPQFSALGPSRATCDAN